MGPHSCECGIHPLRKEVFSDSLKLQWGRTPVSAESLEDLQDNDFQLVASMGPHSCECGIKARRQKERIP